MKRKLIPFLIIVIVPQVFLAIAILSKQNESSSIAQIQELKQRVMSKPQKAVDHGLFAELQKDFKTPQEVTAACLSCHTGRAKEVMSTHHWLWERESFIEGRGVVSLGKKNLLNNYCTGIRSSEGSCNKCHAGYGWGDKSFDFTNELNVDCIVCHDNTETYEKASGGSGYPYMEGPLKPDYKHITANIGKPTKYNCGYCHFYSAGGNNIKHGHLEEALLDCSRDVDVHMTSEGMDMNCTDCHETKNHVMNGRYYGTASNDYNRATCEQCHGDYPHEKSILNEHSIKVTCQACHIPVYAKVNSTKLYWDWSTSTRMKDGQPYEEKDSLGNKTYQSIKGSAQWANNVKPEYVWFNGQANHTLVTDSLTEFPVKINTLYGEYRDPKAKIWPVKIHRGKQPMDKNYKRLLQAKLWDAEKNKGALWVDFNWDEALKKGMEYIDVPYSGEWEFVETEMYLPISHMVSPKEKTVSCNECHTRENSRLEGLTDFYLPGRDRNKTVDLAGTLIIVLSILGVMGHGALRVLASKKRKQQQQNLIGE